MRTTVAPSGVITLTTDFGLDDPFVGVMKGVMYGRFPAARIVDLTHGILPHWPAEAGFWLARSFGYFPTGTVHVAVVDPGVGSARDILLATLDGHFFLAPDNGLLAPSIARARHAEVRKLAATALSSLGLSRVSATFHGRDIFAPMAAEIAAGRRTIVELGTPTAAWVPCWIDEPVVDREAVSGSVVTIDHFGNLITNIEGDSLAGFVEAHAYAASSIIPLRRTYSEAPPGEFLALVNSFGVLEIAVAEGAAADRLGLSRGAPVTVRDAVRHR